MKQVVLKPVVVLAGAALALGWTVPAHAVVLEQKWQAGQNIGYDLALDGAVNMQAPPDAPMMMAGVPIEVAVKGNGRAQLETIKVDPAGIGTVAFKLPKAQVNMETFGQKFQFNVNNGASQMTWNGKPQNMGPALNLSQLVNPTTAVKIGKDGRVQGLEALGTAPNGTTANGQTANGTAPNGQARALGQAGAMGQMILQALPALWPGRDVQPNETWQVNLDIPPALRPGGPNAANAPKSLGTFNMTLKGEEQVGAKKYWRVGVVGNAQVDASQWRQGPVKPTALQVPPGGGAGPRRGGGGMGNIGSAIQFDAATQRVEGDMWFDAEAGQIVRAELGLNSRAQGRTAKPGGGWSAPSWVDFAGTLELQRQGG